MSFIDKILIFLVMTASFPLALNGFVYKIQKMKWNNSNLYFLSDDHTDSTACGGFSQQNTIIDFVKKNKAALVVEDTTTHFLKRSLGKGDFHKDMWAKVKRIYTSSESTPLKAIEFCAVINGISVANVEFRHSHLSFSDIIKEDNKIIDYISILDEAHVIKSSDGKYYSDKSYFYRRILHDYFSKLKINNDLLEVLLKTSLSPLSLTEKSPVLVKQILNKQISYDLDRYSCDTFKKFGLIGFTYKVDKQEILKNKKEKILSKQWSSIYNGALLDVFILDEIMHNKNENLVVYAGGWHVSNIVKELCQRGAIKNKSLREIPIDLAKEFKRF